MVLRFFLLAITFLFIFCSVPERDSPYDPNGINYQGGQIPSVPSSSSVVPSSSSTPPSSSSASGTSGTFTDSRDGKIYKWVKIGTQTWMAENLNYNADISDCYYNQASNCTIYGRLYDWNTAMKACPTGWHLPTKTEWNILTAFIGGESTEGKYLKATSGWKSNGNGEDAFGFSALPGGNGDSGGYFVSAGYYGYWWSSSEYTSSSAYFRGMDYNDENAYWNGYDKDYLFSVRCLQD